jgi:hypothetical protein
LQDACPAAHEWPLNSFEQAALRYGRCTVLDWGCGLGDSTQYSDHAPGETLKEFSTVIAHRQ